MQQKVRINNLTHYKLIILNNDHYKILYNIEIIILIIPKINLLIYFDHKWMCGWNFIEGEMKLWHSNFGSLLQPCSGSHCIVVLFTFP
jgi:hypothetical protein